jgi:hypothetical protein
MSRRTVTRWVEQGRIPCLPNGLIPVQEALVALSQNVRRKGHQPHRRGGITVARTGAAGPGTRTQVDLEHARVRLAERRLRLRKLQGAVIDLDEARRVVATLAVHTRMQWEIWPARIANEMAAELGVDEGKLCRGLEERVREQLRAIAKEPPPELGLRP